MKAFNLTLALQIAGILHLGLLCAGSMMPGVVGMRSHLVALPPFIRQLFWVYYSFIGLCLVSFGTITIRQSAPSPPILAQNVSLTLDWQPSWMFEFGVTRYLENGWHVSAGYVFNENSVPDAHYTPLVADLNRHFISVGGGLKGKRFDFDLAFQFGYGPARTVTGSEPSTAGQIAGQSAD